MDEATNRTIHIGDKVRVIDNLSEHGFELGDIVNVIDTIFTCTIICESLEDASITWYLCEREVELVVE